MGIIAIFDKMIAETSHPSNPPGRFEDCPNEVLSSKKTM